MGLEAEHAERDARVCELRDAGLTLQEIATVFGLTHERVRQIVGPTTPERAAAAEWRRDVLRAARERDFDSLHEQAIRRMYETGASAQAIADEIGTGVTHVREALRRYFAPEERIMRSRRSRADMDRPARAREEILADLRSAAKSGRLTGSAYDRWARDRSGPVTRSRVVQVFGSWNAALAEAGLPPSPAPDRRYVTRHSAEACCAALRRAAEKVGGPPSATEYERVREPGDPSLSTIRNRFGGSWLDAVEAACQ